MLSSLDQAVGISLSPHDLFVWAGESAHGPQSQIPLLQGKQYRKKMQTEDPKEIRYKEWKFN